MAAASLNRTCLVRPLLVSACVVVAPLAVGADEAKPTAASSVIDRVDRTIGKQPKYAATPRYALMLLGTAGESKVWMVEDDKTLYVDKNGNGDLTDDGPPIQQSNVSARDCDYVVEGIASSDGAAKTTLNLSRWNYDDPQDKYGLAITVDGTTPMYSGWFGPFWGPSPEKAQVFHFGGPLTPGKLRGKSFFLGAGNGRLSIGFFKGGRSDGSGTRLSIEALDKSIVPEVRIDWPVAAGAKPLQTSHTLPDRCCYWEFYNRDFRVPEGVVAGMATMTIELPPGAMPFELTTHKIEVPVEELPPGQAVE